MMEVSRKSYWTAGKKHPKTFFFVSTVEVINQILVIIVTTYQPSYPPPAIFIEVNTL